MDDIAIAESSRPANGVETSTKRRVVKRRRNKEVSLGDMPAEILEMIFLGLDPKTAGAATSVSRRFATISTNRLYCTFLYLLVAIIRLFLTTLRCNLGNLCPTLFRTASSSRFWLHLLKVYWHTQKEFSDGVSSKLLLSNTLPVPQIHFMSHRHFALSVQDSAFYASGLAYSIHPDCSYLGLSLPPASIRNALARFYTDRQFFIAAFENDGINFTGIVLSPPKLSLTHRDETQTGKKNSKKRKPGPLPNPRHFLPLHIDSSEDHARFLNNFKGAKVNGSTEAMLLSQAITSLFVSLFSEAAIGRLTLRIPGLASLPPTDDIDKYLIRAMITITKIPIIHLHFEYQHGILSELTMQWPNFPWQYGVFDLNRN